MNTKSISVKSTDPISAPLKIKVDVTEITHWCETLKENLGGLVLKELPEALRDQLLSLFEGRFLDGSIRTLGSTTIAGNHIVRLGVGGQLESIAAAVRALKANCVG